MRFLAMDSLMRAATKPDPARDVVLILIDAARWAMDAAG